MFSKKKTFSNGEKINTILGVNTTIEGNLISEGTIRIDGDINGDLEVEGCVYIGENAHVKGNVTASDIELSGTIEGNINAKGILKLLSTAKLYGDIKVQSLIIDEGSIFHGSSDMFEQKTISFADKSSKDSTRSRKNASVLDDVYKEKELEKQEKVSK